jgi:hypothetical protein
MLSPETASIDTGLIKLLDDYFEVIHAQDMQLFDKVFHKDCTLYSTQDGELVIRPYALYRDQVANRRSPKELGNPRKDEILEIDQISDSTAWAKVQLFQFGGIMQDYLNFLKINGEWWIIAKLYQKVGEY